MEIGRRLFLKTALTVGVAVGTAEVLLPVAHAVNAEVAKITDRPTGNANVNTKIQEVCADAKTSQECKEKYLDSLTPSDKLNSVVIAPFTEEVLFRAIPATLIDTPSDTKSFGLSKTEVIVGGISTAAFGAVHNLLPGGKFDMRTIPASQTVSGMVYWYLQRKFGFLSNTIAHAWNNFRILSS